VTQRKPLGEGDVSNTKNFKSQISNQSFHPIPDKYICIMATAVIAVAAENDLFAIG
jgi:hypothetical protein